MPRQDQTQSRTQSGIIVLLCFASSLLLLDYTVLLLGSHGNISIINHLCVCLLSGFVSRDSNSRQPPTPVNLFGRISYYFTPYFLNSNFFFSVFCFFSMIAGMFPLQVHCFYSLCCECSSFSICMAQCFTPLYLCSIMPSQGELLFLKNAVIFPTPNTQCLSYHFCFFH